VGVPGIRSLQEGLKALSVGFRKDDQERYPAPRQMEASGVPVGMKGLYAELGE
jgi:hypothetical protein